MSTAVKTERIYHPPTDSLDLSSIMRTLGDPLRLELVRVIGQGDEFLCGELSERMGMPTSTASYHLKLLREAGVTRSRAVGTQRLISLRRDDLERRFPGLVELITAAK